MAPERRRPPVRALGLLSGGLDSTLAARLLQEQGVEVSGVHFSTGFCKVDHRRAMKRPSDLSDPRRLRNEALRAGADLNAPVEIVDVSEEYLREVVIHPKYGYGSAMNPCIDCRIFMLRKAGEMARSRGIDLVFTGEVVGQRPMSQHRAALETIEADSGLRGRLLRPLSAAFLPATQAEEDGRIDRARLGRAHGRARREQLRLAQRMGISEFPAPSGGCCFLADPSFGRRLRDLLAHRDAATIRPEDLTLLKVGRHFRVSHDLKAILGRDEAESRLLRLEAGGRWICQVADGKGAFGLLDGEAGEEGLRRAAALAARYSGQRHRDLVEVRAGRQGDERIVRVQPAGEDEIRRSRI